MEIILKLGFITIALTATFTTNAYAFECNTVMGGCPTDSTQVTSAHMIADVTNKLPALQKTQNNKATASPANATTATQNKLGNKKSPGQGSLMQTLNKKVLK